MMASPLFSTLLGDVAQWDNPNPHYNVLMTKVGHADHPDALNSTAAAVMTVNLAQRSPVAIAFIVEGDDDHVHVGHSPSVYPADPSNPSPYDNLVVVLVGDDVNSAIPVVLPALSFTRVPNLHVFDFDQQTAMRAVLTRPASLRRSTVMRGGAGLQRARVMSTA